MRFIGKAKTHPSTLHMDGTSPVTVHVRATTEELRRLDNQEVEIRLVDEPKWYVHTDMDSGESHLLWMSHSTPVAEWYWLSANENPDDSSNTIPFEALEALIKLLGGPHD